MKKENGITLIALIITIIIMLILVSVSISILINSGLIEKAKYAGQETKTAYDRDSRVGDSLNINGVIYNGIDEYIATINGEDEDLAKLQEFFGKGYEVIVDLDTEEFNDNIEPIPDASTSINYIIGIDVAEYVRENIFVYNNKIYSVITREDSYQFGEVTRKQYSSQFTTIATQGEKTSNPFNNGRICFDYENQRYGLDFVEESVSKYYLPTSSTGEIYLYNYYYEKVSISSEYNPRLWIDNEEREVDLEQDGAGYTYIQLKGIDNGKQYRITLTIDEETVEEIETVTVVG